MAAAAVPFVESAWGAAPGVVLGIQPATAMLAAITGNMASVLLLVNGAHLLRRCPSARPRRPFSGRSSRSACGALPLARSRTWACSWACTLAPGSWRQPPSGMARPGGDGGPNTLPAGSLSANTFHRQLQVPCHSGEFSLLCGSKAPQESRVEPDSLNFELT